MTALEKRQQERVALKFRVDAKQLDRSEVENILQGEGYPDLSQPSMARRLPREGMESAATEDLSISGIQLQAPLGLETGATLAVDLHLPGDPVVLKALTEVMWVQGGQKPQRAGLRFVALGGREVSRLKGALADEGKY